MNTKTKLLLADDQVLFVQNLKAVLDMTATDLEVVSIAYTGRETLDAVASNKIDIILMDVRMPDLDGVQATRILLGKYPDLRIIMLTTFDDDQYVHQALNFGASGYLLKDISAEELISAIHAVRDGAFSVSPSIARKLASEKRERKREAEGTNLRGPDWWKSLSRREREILCLTVAGWNNEAVAEKLFISRYTVRNNLSVIYSKLGVSNRMDLKRFVEREGADLESLIGGCEDPKG